MRRLERTLLPHRLPVLVLVCICGLLFGKTTWIPASPILLLLPPLIFLAGAVRYKRFPFRPLCILLALFCSAAILSDHTSRPPGQGDDLYNTITAPADRIVTGTLAEMPAYDGESTRITLQTRTMTEPETGDTFAVTGKLLLRLSFPWPQEILPGDLVALRATLIRPNRYKTAGSFDYPAFLATRGIWVIGFVRSPVQLIGIEQDQTISHKVRYLPEKVRNTIGRFLDDRIQDNAHRGMYRALLLGDRSQIPDYLDEWYKGSGLSHILAISGLHLSLIGTLFFLLFYYLLRRSEYLTLRLPVKKTALVLCLPILIAYTFLAGLNAPSLRACLMASIGCLAFCSNRRKSPLPLVSGVALILLIAEPQQLYSASFQLSFSAVLAIFLILPALRILISGLSDQDNGFRSIPHTASRLVVASLLVSTAATLGTAPILLYHFHRFPLAGPIANLIVEPLICLWALPCGFLALPLIPWSPRLATMLLEVGGSGIDLANQIAAWVCSLPGGNLWLPSPSLSLIALYYCTLLLALGSTGSRWLIRTLISLCFILVLARLLAPGIFTDNSGPEGIRVTFIDVGQGSATLVELSGGRTLLIDGGASSSKSAIGERVIAPLLWTKGFTRLDGIIITHPDSDHYNGIPFLVEHFSPGFLWTATHNDSEAGYGRLLALCQKRGVKIIVPEDGELLQFGRTHIRCLANTLAAYPATTSSNNGLVLRLQHKGLSILFPGDIEHATEQKLIDGLSLEPSDILLAAHHGSATSNSIPFLESIRPKAIIVSAGQSRKKIYPGQHLEHYGVENSIPLYTTHSDGSMVVEYTDDRIVLSRCSDWQDTPLRRNRIEPIPAQQLQARGVGIRPQ